MITIIVKIGSKERQWESFRDIEESWITEQLHRSRQSGQSVCVVVRLQSPDINLSLATPTCGGGGGGRRPNAQEQRIIGLWHDRGLSSSSLAPGQVIAFLSQLRHLL
jgi:hypothetical protein